VQIAWMRGGAYPDMPFNQQMTFPCDLTLRTVNGALRVFRRPAREIEGLHGKEHAVGDLDLAARASRPLPAAGDLFRILAEVEIPPGTTLTFHVRGAGVTLTEQSIACKSKPVPVEGRVRTVEILVDRTSIEAFANDGAVSLSACSLPTDDRLAVSADGGAARVRSLRVIQLKAAWDEGATRGAR
jgi:levanase/fructan beta-fructosidase